MLETQSNTIVSKLRGFEEEFKVDLLNVDLKTNDIHNKYIKQINNFRNLIKTSQQKLLLENYKEGYTTAIKEIGEQIDYEPIENNFENSEVLELFNKDLENNLILFNNIFDNVINKINSISLKRDTFLKMSNSNTVKKNLLKTNFSDFLEKGFNVVTYKDNKKVNFINYFKLVFDGMGRKAYETAHSLARIDNNVYLVKIPDKSTACEKCQPYLRKVLFDDKNFSDLSYSLKVNYETLSQAYENGLFHINCKDTYEAYVEKDYENKLDLLNDEFGIPRFLQNGEELNSKNIPNYKDDLFEYFDKNVYNKDNNYGDKLLIRYLDKVYRNHINSYSSLNVVQDVYGRISPLAIAQNYFNSNINNGISTVAYHLKNNEILNDFSKWLTFEQWLNDTYPRSKNDITVDNLLMIDRRKDSEVTFDSLKIEILAGLLGIDFIYDIADISEALERDDEKDAVISLLFMLPLIGVAKGLSKLKRIKKLKHSDEIIKSVEKTASYLDVKAIEKSE